jgi:hypothetical protein
MPTVHLPLQFPELPATNHGQNVWHDDVLAAHTILCDTYYTARQTVDLEDPDPLQIACQVNRISTEMLEILCALESWNEGGGSLPSQWLQDAAEILGELVNKLQASQQTSRLR